MNWDSAAASFAAAQLAEAGGSEASQVCYAEAGGVKLHGCV